MRTPIIRTALVLMLMSLPVLGPIVTSAAAAESELEDSMGAMNSAFKKLRRQVADPAQNEASLVLVAKLRKAAVEGAKAVPEKVTKLPSKDQAAQKADYADKMNELITSIDELAAALKAGKNADAGKIVDDLVLQEEAGHKKFRPEKDK